MTTKTIDNIDDAYKVVTDLLAAADAGQHVRLTPMQAAMVAQLVAKGRSKAAPYLEAAVRQVGGRLHIDTPNLIVSTGRKVKYLPDHDTGHGGVLYIDEEGT